MDSPGCGSEIIKPQWEMLLSVQVFLCAADDSHQRCKCSVSRLGYSGAGLLLLPLKLGCSVWSQPLSGLWIHLCPILFQLLHYYLIQTLTRAETNSGSIFPFPVDRLHPSGLPRWVNIPPCKLQESNLIRKNQATYPDNSNYPGSAN